MILIIKLILYLIVLATSIPVGYYLAWLCSDELRKDRKYFFMLAFFLSVAAILLLFIYFKPSIIFSLAYMAIVLLVMIKKRF